MDIFVKRAGKTLLTNIHHIEEQAIDAVILKDCQLCEKEIEVGDIFIPPGIIIQQQRGEIVGRRLNNVKVFSFMAEEPMEQLIIDTNRLFGIGRTGNAYIYHFNGTTAEIHELHRHPLGWCIVPKTRMMVHWNLLTLRMYDPNTGKNTELKRHSSRITSGTAECSILATGDSTGHLGIWYVSSWECFHYITTGQESIDEIVISASENICVKTDNHVFVYDIHTGEGRGHFALKANSVQYNVFGLIIAHGEYIEVFDGEQSMIKLKHEATRLVRSVHTRCWAVHDREIVELELDQALASWSGCCLEWIQSPIFPFHHTWPTLRYMDVLALASEEWLSKVDYWEPPRQWMRHRNLRTAIWKYAAKYNMALSTSWLFLPHETLQEWYTICMNELIFKTASFEYEPHVVNIIEHIYRHVNITNKGILKWCWFHHDKMRMRNILIQLSQNDAKLTLLYTVIHEIPTSVSILCVDTTAIQYWINQHFVAIFIKWLIVYHQVHEPTRQTQKIYEYIATYLFATIEFYNCDIPFPESGQWLPKERILPNDVGKYVKVAEATGFITKVTLNKDRTIIVHWQPNACFSERVLEERADVWQFNCNKGPNTLLECALTILNKDLWYVKEAMIPFKWFQSEVEAFMNNGKLIAVLDKPMRIVSAIWGDNGASLQTSTGMTLHENDQLPIEIERQGWSYIRDTSYDLAPLRLKICHITAKQHNIRLPLKHAHELLQCCLPKTIHIENAWEIKNPVTAITSDTKFLITGCKNGNIHQFVDLSQFNYPIRTFKYHNTSVLSLHTYESRLLSVSEDNMCIWSLTTGMLLFNKKTDLRYVTIIPYVAMQVWIIQHDNYTIATLWDIEDETPLKQISLPDCQHIIGGYHIQDMSVLIYDSSVVLWSEEKLEHPIQIPLRSTITCSTSTDTGIVGGTSDGRVFTMQMESEKIKEWIVADSSCITAVAYKDDFIIIGNEHGQIYLFWTN